MMTHRSRTGCLWRKLVAGLAAYSIALQLALSGLALALSIGPSSAAVPICGEHAAGPSDLPAPAGNPWPCACAAACASGATLLSDAPAIPSFAGAILPVQLSDCDSPADLGLAVRGPQIPRAPPTA